MRSHVMAESPTIHLAKPREVAEVEDEEEEEGNGSSPSPSSSSLQEGEGEEEGKAQALYYGLRENPKKSIRIADPEFSFALDSGSVVQDRESETESSKNPFRRRSKRRRRSAGLEPEQEPVSSVSDTTPEEDVAICLMMLSRDTWMTGGTTPLVESEEEEEGGEEEEETKFCPRGRNKYQCGTCKKVFHSYQALGGHRASHKKMKSCARPPPTPQAASEKLKKFDSESGNPYPTRVHQCPVCFRVFKSGQALGGHKRSHLSATASTSISVSASASASATPTKFGESLIDLNLPAPFDEDDFSQVELSAVSDAEFVDPAN